MKKFISIMLMMAVILAVFTGCSSEATKEASVEVALKEGAKLEYETRNISFITEDGQNIYGIAYVPQGIEGKLPTVIFSHGFNDTHEYDAKKAQFLAMRGIVTYTFDYPGGSVNSKSDGSMLEMSVFSEQEDLSTVIDSVKNLDFVDENNLFLYGTSMGGFVASLVAAERPDEIKGLVLLFPAFTIPDDARTFFATVEDIPETYSVYGADIGKSFYQSVFDYDIYEHIDSYTSDVLIFHGAEDPYVPVSYSQKAQEVYHSAELIIVPGEGHGFSDIATDDMMNKTAHFIQAQVNK